MNPSFLILALLLSTAHAANCRERKDWNKVCVGDRIYNESATTESELFGTVLEISKWDMQVRYESGRVGKEYVAASVIGSVDCQQVNFLKVCVGDTVIVTDDKTSSHYRDEEIKVTKLTNISYNPKEPFLSIVGVSKNGNLRIERHIALKSGPIPGENLIIGDVLQSGHKIVAYVVGKRPHFRVTHPESIYTENEERNTILALNGAKEIPLLDESTDWTQGYVTKQTELYNLYKERLANECHYLNKNRPSEITDVKVEVTNLKTRARLLFGSECLPIPIPWISRETTLKYKATGTCRFLD